MKRERRVVVAATFVSTLIMIATDSVAEYPVAGVEPSQRPAGAPVIREFKKGDEWYAQAKTGITKPYPPSLSFLEDQGPWYTPFNHPGMMGSYDIRGWHKAKR